MNMAYISLDELKEILPDIFNAWMDDNDEGWEWIFQEIEQKCHVGKRKKNKKRKKHIEGDISTLKSDISVLSDRYGELNKKVDELRRYSTNNLSSRINELSNKISNQSASHVALTSRVGRVENDIKAAKLMAQTAKQRTEVDYTKYSGKSDGEIKYDKEKSDADVVQEVYNRISGRGATFEELENFRNLIQKYDALEKKEIPVVRKACETCKLSATLPFDQPCSQCCYNGMNATGIDKWEAKDNG